MGVAEPGSLKLRYDHLTGGESERNVYYMARRHLGLSFAGWDALPWHEQQTYLEGLVAEFSDADRADPPAFEGELPGMTVEHVG